MRKSGSAKELEQLRRLAVARVNDGYAVAEVARFLGCHVVTIRRWVRLARERGDAGLAAKSHPGRARKLSQEQEDWIVQTLRKEPAWTTAELAKLIHSKFGVTFHRRYLNVWLRRRGLVLKRA